MAISGFGVDHAAAAFAALCRMVSDGAAALEQEVFERSAGAVFATFCRVVSYTAAAVERQVFDGGAGVVVTAGLRVRVVQSGKVDHYLVALLVWALVAAIGVVLVLLR